METYEQKYKEALERASLIKDNNTSGTPQEIVEYIFPELRESEDEKIRKAIREVLLDAPAQDLVNKDLDLEQALAWLEKQKEQKPVEWSEEDEDNMRRIIRVLEDNDSDWKELSSWLKSLHPQPHWKPSEEQMKALNKASRGHYIELFEYDELVNLYNDLKKL